MQLEAYLSEVQLESYLPEMQLIDGWITCNITSFSKVFQSYQDHGSLIMNGYVQ